ncbi:MAG: hypothetical protein DKM50_07590 [Candidatus Margulisiibacteriota bacterium]|nr:MAG: hypothetical protein DKM50_07590 [Candidatus Margulisiibacteriota bacterium]
MVMQIKMATKIQVALGVLTFFVIGISLFSISNINKINKQDKLLYERITVPLGDMVHIVGIYNDIRINLRALMLSSTDAEKYALNDRTSVFRSQLEAALNKYSTTLIDAVDAEKLKNFKDEMVRYNKVYDAIAALASEGNLEGAKQLTATPKTKEIVKAVQEALDMIVVDKINDAKLTAESNDKTAKSSSAESFILLIIASIISIAVAIYLTVTYKKIISGFMAEMEKLINAAISGNIDERADVRSINFEFRPLIEGVNVTIDSLVGHIDSIPTPTFIINTDFTIKYVNQIIIDIIGLPKNQIVGTKCYTHFKTSDCNTERCACARAMKEGHLATSETDAHPGKHNLEISYSGKPIKNSDGKIIGALEIISDQTEIKKVMKASSKVAEYQSQEVSRLIKALDNLAKGDISFNLEVGEGDVDTAGVKNNFSMIAGALNTLTTAQKMLVEAANEIAEGNLTTKLQARSDSDQLIIAMAKMTDKLDKSLSVVAETVQQVTSGAEQISDASQSLSQGATEQSSSLEEITSSMAEIGSQTKINAENANQANTLSKTVRSSAESGQGKMKEMVSAMGDISDSSMQISKIIKVIDEIAFQTNLLALNAAVEAARAGRHGKGFAVVADEVRNLAGRSSKAAKETAELIESSISKVKAGTTIAEITSESFKEIVNGIVKVTDIVGEIAAASSEQAEGVIQINQGLSQIDKVTQQNTANAEETASAAEELSSQAISLKRLTDEFKLSNTVVSREGPRTQDVPVQPKKKMPAKGWGSPSNKPVISLDDNNFGKF